MAATKIMLMRHAEKPSLDGSNIGVDEFGQANAHGLSVRGWQRAAALIGFFASASKRGLGIARPDVLFAASAVETEDSLRSLQTILPLARFLGLRVNTDFRKEQTTALAEALTSEVNGVALVCWEHRAIPAIAQALLGKAVRAPQVWPEDCFALVWVFDQQDDGYSISQVPQSLLAGDTAPPNAAK